MLRSCWDVFRFLFAGGVVVVIGVRVRALFILGPLGFRSFLDYPCRREVVLLVTEIVEFGPVVLRELVVIHCAVYGFIVCWMEFLPAARCYVVGGDEVNSVFAIRGLASRYHCAHCRDDCELVSEAAVSRGRRVVCADLFLLIDQRFGFGDGCGQLYWLLCLGI